MSMNMGYCRFENTAEALSECLEDMPNSLDDLPSDSEREGYKKLLRLCTRIANEYGEANK